MWLSPCGRTKTSECCLVLESTHEVPLLPSQTQCCVSLQQAQMAGRWVVRATEKVGFSPQDLTLGSDTNPFSLIAWLSRLGFGFTFLYIIFIQLNLGLHRATWDSVWTSARSCKTITEHRLSARHCVSPVGPARLSHALFITPLHVIHWRKLKLRWSSRCLFLIKLRITQSDLSIDGRGGLFSPTDMIYYLNDQVITEELVLGFWWAWCHLSCTLQFPLWLSAWSQHRHSKRSRFPYTMHKTPALFSVTSGWGSAGRKNPVFLGSFFFYWCLHTTWLFSRYVAAGATCEVVCERLCFPLARVYLLLALTLNPKPSYSFFLCLRYWKKTTVKMSLTSKTILTFTELSYYWRNSG